MIPLRRIQLLAVGVVTALTVFACGSHGDGATTSHQADTVGSGQIDDECGAGLSPPVFCGAGLSCQAPSYGTVGADGTCQYVADGGAGQVGEPCLDDTECSPGLSCATDPTTGDSSCQSSDAGAPGADAGAEPDAAPPEPDAAPQEPDADAAAPDAAPQEPDAAPPLAAADDAGAQSQDTGPLGNEGDPCAVDTDCNTGLSCDQGSFTCVPSN